MRVSVRSCFACATAITPPRSGCRHSRSFRPRGPVFRPARLHDAAIGHDVHHVGFDVVEQALVMRDDQKAAACIAPARSHRRTPVSSRPRRGPSPSRRGNAHLGLEHGHLEDLVALFLTAPEKPTLTGRFSTLGVDLQVLGLFADQLEEIARADLLLCRAPCAARSARCAERSCCRRRGSQQGTER